MEHNDKIQSDNNKNDVIVYELQYMICCWPCRGQLRHNAINTIMQLLCKNVTVNETGFVCLFDLKLKYESLSLSLIC